MPNSFDVGSYVWIDGEQGYLVPGVVIGVSGSSLKVQNEETGKISSLSVKLATQRVDYGKHGADDMIKMDDLNEGSILFNLAKRYEANLIYTYIGKILVAVNPYKLYDIFTNDNVDKYTTSTIGSLPPHIFAIGSAAYSEIQRNEMNQVIVISGESGAGKTESTKLLVQYLATANKSKGSLITEQIVEATPLLESFGNAKTVKNDNSSRFGKYLEIYFSNAGLICGGRISEYLLERSRIVSQSVDERNYHIFYEMLAGLPQETKSKLSLKSADDYAYLNQGGSSFMQNKDDKALFNNVLTAMDVLRITPSERDGIFTTLAAILHLGNAQFYKGLASSHDVAVLKDEDEAKIAANLLGLSGAEVIQALTHKNTETRGEQISSPRNTDQAIDARDAIAKELYSRVFTWLVNRINGIVFHGKQGPSIAILDIFGFEDFQTNSFEQLCINYANESLQFFFNQFVFKLEQDEYGLEGIQWREVSFTDNQACLDLLARPPHGILHLLTDESNFPKATDGSFLEKCHQYHKPSKAYFKPKMQAPEFGINHFAGPVTYQVRGFLDKNRDSLKQDLTDLLCKCRSPFVRDLIPDLLGDPTMQIGGLKGIRKNSRVNSLKAPPNSVPKNTVCAKFNDSLIRLVVAMKRCNPFFIRCIKPNPNKAPGAFVQNLVIQQLRYSGVLETVKIRKTGYPVRIGYQDFVTRYKCLSNRIILNGSTSQQNCVIIMDFMEIPKDDYQLGRTKLFLRENVEFQLEESRRAKQLRMAVVIQSRVRGYLINHQYLQMKKATIILQSNARRYLARKKYQKARSGFLMLQAMYRMRRKRRLLTLQLQSESQDESKQITQSAVSAEPPKVTMESKDLEKQAMVDVTQLEIPADLAMVYARLNDWQVPYEKTVAPVNNEVVKFVCPKADLPSDIDDQWFSKYAQKHFQENKLRFVRAPIHTSMLKLKYSDSMEAVTVFKLIMRFMEDETLSGVRELILGNYIVQKGIFNPELQDEIFAQLCNQTWGNQVNSYCEKAWLLIAMCLACYKPSDNLFNALLKYSSDHAYNGFKAYCQQKLLCWKARKRPIPRSLPPSYLEWQAAKRKCSVSLRCESVDGDKKMAEVNSCMTGEELATTILKDRGVSEPRGWSIDVYDPDCHYSLSGHDYVMDVIYEQEYPPHFPPGSSPSLVTLRPGNKLPEFRKRSLSELHRAHHKKAKVAEIAHKFSFSEGSKAPSSPSDKSSGPREDGLSAATSARLLSTQQPTPAPYEDKLVAQTAMRTKTDTTTVVDGQATPVPPPPPPPGIGPVPPPPPPPPPIAPPTDNKIRRRLTSKEGNKKKKKPEPSGPQLSMAEVMAQAKRMSEARRSRAISIDNKENNGTEVDPVEMRIGNLKKVQRNSTPKKEEPENELKLAMQAKANRASRLWQENENLESILFRKDGDENQNESVTVDNNNETQSSLPSTSSQSDEDFATTINVNKNNSLSSNSSNNSLANKQDVSAFVDSLFDPVLSSNFNDLADERSVSNAIRGGGGMNQPNGSAQTSTTVAGASPTTVSMSSPMNGGMFVPMARTPVSSMYNGYPGYTVGGNVGFNGYTGGTQNMASPAIMGVSGYPSPPQDLGTIAAQQQMLIEHLMTQQKLIQEQQRQLSKKSTDHLALLQQQHEQQMRVLQEQLEAAKAGTPNGIPNGLPGETPQGASHVSNGPIVNGHGSEPIMTRRTTVLDRVKSIEPPPPPPEFSDQDNNNSTQNIIIPPPPFTAPPAPPAPPPPPVEEPSIPYPPPPLSPPPPVPQADNQSKSSGVASAVAALEAKSPVSRNSSTEVIQQTVTNEEQVFKPPLKTRHSSNLAVFVQEDKKTEKLNLKNNSFLSPGTTPWKISLRKEVFSPNEKIDNRVEQRLIYLQIVRDSYSEACCRMRATDRSKMKALLQRYGITPEHPHSSTPVEEIIVQTARDLPLYFSRFYTVMGQNELPDINYIFVGEKGVFLVKREKIEEDLSIVNEILYEDIDKVRVVKNKVVFSFKESKISVPTNKAEEVKLMIDPYLIQIEKEAKYVRAMYDYVTQEANMLNFKKGDVIQIIDKPDLDEGWYFGIFADRSGYFPSEYVTHIKEDPDAAPKSNLMKAASVGNLSIAPENIESSPDLSRKRAGSTRSTKSDKSEYGHETYSMMEFAMHNFRHGQEVVHRQPDGTVRGTLRLKGKQSHRGSPKKMEWTWKGLAELVKYSKTSIQASLLRLEPQNNKIAIECFHAIMKFMGDMPMGRGQKDTDLVYFLIKTCRENAELCDEVYCQLVKQVTSNKSTQSDSCSRGWRLMIIMTSYIMCDKTLKPYLVKFLQSTACDPKREFHGAASICEQNLMKTFKYGGRRTHPSPIELKQLVQGRQTKRQVFLLPGKINKMMKIQTCSTGYDVIKEMCNEMDLSTEGDYSEYGLFSSDSKQKNMAPIQTTDYVMDVIGQMEKGNTEFNLWFRRVLWIQTSRFDNELYCTVIYHQILPDYTAGYLTGVLRDRSVTDAMLHNQVAELGALQILASDNGSHTPIQSDVDKVIPRFIRDKLRAQQWLILVQDHFRSSSFTPAQARKRFLEIVSQWQFFGSTFFSVKYCSHPNVAGECIATINRNGINFIDVTSKKLLQSETFARIISTRILISDKKRFFLDLKIGDSMVQKVTRMETQEAKEIAGLIYNYVNVASAVMNRPHEGLAGVIRQQDLKL